MKLLTFLSGLAIAALTILGCSSTKSVVDHTRASIVRVTTQTEDGSVGVCSGFVVQPRIVLTANHCVGLLMQADGYEAKLIDKDDFYDLAAIEVTLSKKTPLELRDDPVVEGEELIGVGYGWGWTFPVATHVKVLSPSYRVYPNRSIGIVTQGNFYHGMSGGPVVDLDGKVVGIVQQSIDGANFNVGVTMMKAFLTTAGVI